MKLKIFVTFLLSFCIVFFETGAFGDSKQTLQSPIPFVSESQFTFDSVLDGAEVTHDFIIQNKGTAPLNIEKVKTG